MSGNALIHFLGYLFGWDAPHTQTTTNEQSLLRKYAQGAKIAVEIGVYEGVNTVNIAHSMALNGTLYGIDPFTKGKLGLCYGLVITQKELRKNGLSPKVNLIAKYSFDAANDVPGRIDFIFIDGDHSYSGIQRDWELWSPKITTGGIVALHDTSLPIGATIEEELGSHRYFREVITKDGRFVLIESIDSLNILRKIS